MGFGSFVRRFPSGIATVLTVLAAAPALGAGQGFDRGQALYENHCEACHEAGAHKPEKRRATSLGDLRARVAAWSMHAGLGWGSAEIDDVTRYLNRRFYRFRQ